MTTPLTAVASRMARVDWQCALNRALHALGERSDPLREHYVLTAAEFDAADHAYADHESPETFAQLIVDARRAQADGIR